VIDGRRAEAYRMKEVRADLVSHVGGHPTVTQALLIDRIAVLLLRMELMDAEALRGSAMSDKDAKAYLGWNNTVSRMLRQLGLKGAANRGPTLADYISRKSEPPA
jgi:hypothetical protein